MRGAAPSLTTIRADVLDFLAGFMDDLRVGDDDPLITGGLVNSLVAVQLIDLISERYGVTVADEDLDLANFDTVAGIHAFVERALARP